MVTLSKSDLKARLLEHLRHVEATGDEIIITSHGREVAKIVPIAPRRTAAELFADVQGRGLLPTDAELTEPVGDAWADSDIADLVR